MTLVQADRRHDGVFFTGKQFAALLGGILSAQLAVNWFAAKSFVRDVAVEVTKQHNTDPEAHARALLQAQAERNDMIKQIVVLQTKIDGLENMIRALSAQGAFNHQPAPKGSGR